MTDQLKIENRLPDCVLMKLHSTSAQQEQVTSLILSTLSKPLAISSGEINLKLTIRFYKQKISVPGGQVEFGLKRGELKLSLENGTMPLEKVLLKSRLVPEIEVECQQENTGEIEANIAIAPALKNRDSYKTAMKSKYLANQVSTRGTEEEPVWVFECKTNESFLVGQLTEEPLGMIHIKSAPCRVKATFEVRGQRDLFLIESEGLFKAKKLSRNKTAWLTIEFLRRFIEPNLKPYLSQVDIVL